MTGPGDHPTWTITVDDPALPEVRAVIERHLALAHAVTPVDDVHALDPDGLLDATITVFSARQRGEVLGIGALRQLDSHHGELKSMHTIEEARGLGIGRAILEHLIGEAKARGYERVSLETGTMDAFKAARMLYQSVGFEECAPFGDYPDIPGSICMTMLLGV